VTTYAERLTKIGLVLADEWTTIVNRSRVAVQFPSIRMFSAETTGLIVTKILHDIVALAELFNHAYTRHYLIPFLNATVISAGVGNFATKLVAMATSLKESEKMDMIKKNHANTFDLVKSS